MMAVMGFLRNKPHDHVPHHACNHQCVYLCGRGRGRSTAPFCLACVLACDQLPAAISPLLFMTHAGRRGAGHVVEVARGQDIHCIINLIEVAADQPRPELSVQPLYANQTLSN